MYLLLSLTITCLCLVLNLRLINMNNALFHHFWYGTGSEWTRWASHIFRHFIVSSRGLPDLWQPTLLQAVQKHIVHATVLNQEQKNFLWGSRGSLGKAPADLANSPLCMAVPCQSLCMELQSSRTHMWGQVKPLTLRQWWFKRTCTGCVALECLQEGLYNPAKGLPTGLCLLRKW